MIPVIFNFALVVLILYFSTRKAVKAMFATRSATIQQEMAEAETMSAESDKLLGQAETNFKSIEAHTKSMQDETKKTVERLRTTTIEHARAEAVRIEKEAKLVGESEKTKATENLRRELAHKSVQLASQYLSTHLNDDDRQRLVSEYTERVGNGSTR